jgi:hypothetical protein
MERETREEEPGSEASKKPEEDPPPARRVTTCASKRMAGASAWGKNQLRRSRRRSTRKPEPETPTRAMVEYPKGEVATETRDGGQRVLKSQTEGSGEERPAEAERQAGTA